MKEINDTLKESEIDAYPNVCVNNKTNYEISVKVEYACCSSDTAEYLKPGEHTSFKRGACLLISVWATVHTGSKNIDAKHYYSSGTAYSHFNVNQITDERFEIVRY